MQVVVRTASVLRDLIGAETLTVHIGAGCTVQELVKVLALATFSKEPAWDSLIMIRNGTHVQSPSETCLSDGDTIVILPMVDGG